MQTRKPLISVMAPVTGPWWDGGMGLKDILGGRARMQGAPSRSYTWAAPLAKGDADTLVQLAMESLHRHRIEARYDAAGNFVTAYGGRIPLAPLAQQLSCSARWNWSDLVDAFFAK